jgi:hypothetical protein
VSIELYSFLKCAIDFMAFVTSLKEFSTSDQLQEDGTQFKARPYQHVESDRTFKDITPAFDKFKVALNSQLYKEGIKFDEEMQTKQLEIEQTKRVIKELKKKESVTKWSRVREDKAVKKAKAL